jgi:hypothetical protein
MTATTQFTRSVVTAKVPLAYQLGPPKLYQSVIAARLPLVDLVVGEVVLAFGRVEVELPQGPDDPARAMLCSFLKLTWTGSTSHTEGVRLVDPMGTNPLKSQHYGLQEPTGAVAITATWTGAASVLLVVYAAGLSGPDDPRSLTVKYANLRTVRIR